MAVVTSSLTFTAGQFRYIDVFGIEHTVVTSQTLNLVITDNSATDVHYNITGSCTLTDGRKLESRSMASNATNGLSNGNGPRTVASLTDAGQGSPFYSLRGEFFFVCPESGTVQRWVPAQITPSDTDFGSSGTITMILEDQFGHRMSIPFQLISTVAVGQAS